LTGLHVYNQLYTDPFTADLRLSR